MKITEIVIHCADTPNGRSFSAKDIDDWHRERGWTRTNKIFNPQFTSIGYHFVIKVDGTIETGRAEDEEGAQALYYNTRSLAICMIGRDKFTKAQWGSLGKLIWDLRLKYPGHTLLGHRDVAPHKTCPGFDVTTYAVDMEPSPEHIFDQPAVG